MTTTTQPNIAMVVQHGFQKFQSSIEKTFFSDQVIDTDTSKEITFFPDQKINTGTNIDDSFTWKLFISPNEFSKHVKHENDGKSDPSSTKDYSMLNHLAHKLEVIKDLKDDDISVMPSEDVIENVRTLIPDLVSHNLIPYRITPSIEDGLCLVFRKLDVIVYVEFYNDGEIGLISENCVKKIILDNIDITINNVIPELRRILSQVVP